MLTLGTLLLGLLHKRVYPDMHIAVTDPGFRYAQIQGIEVNARDFYSLFDYQIQYFKLGACFFFFSLNPTILIEDSILYPNIYLNLTYSISKNASNFPSIFALLIFLNSNISFVDAPLSLNS